MIYVSGPMSGIGDKNRPLFKSWQTCLEILGYDVINPHELPDPSPATWESYLERDLSVLCECTVIFMLPGWRKSKGALLEYEFAKYHKIKRHGFRK